MFHVAIVVGFAMFGIAGESVLAGAAEPVPIAAEDEAAIAEGYVALCNDGNYSNNSDFDATCSGGDGIDHWLGQYGRCNDGRVIAVSPDASCDGHDGFDTILPPSFVPQAGPDDVAVCEAGTYSDNTDFDKTCNSAGGVDAWLAPYGTCSDGRVIAMSADASCDGHDGFDELLPVDFVPMPTLTDVARCADGTHSDNTDFDDTCNSAGGVSVWLAPTGVCEDGTEVAIGPDTDCGAHDGFDHLNLVDIATCSDGSTSTYLYLPNTCADAGGVEAWLDVSLECADGTLIVVDEQAACDEHGGIVAITHAAEASPATTTTTAPPQSEPPTTTMPSTTPPSSTTPATTTTAPLDLSAPGSCTIGETLRLGDSGEAVRCLQQRLIEIGATTRAPTGTFDDATDSEVRRVQGELGLAVDGVVGPQTAGALGFWEPAAPIPATPVTAIQPAVGEPSVFYANCDAARAAGAAPLYRGEPGYRSSLDRDDDGVACE